MTHVKAMAASVTAAFSLGLRPWDISWPFSGVIDQILALISRGRKPTAAVRQGSALSEVSRPNLPGS